MTATISADPAASSRARPSIELSREATALPVLLRELWAARQLLVILARKEFHVRYRRASFGVLWAVGLPLLQSLVLALVFSHVTRIRNAPHYAVFMLSGMTAWIYFSLAMSAGSTAIVDNTEISNKVYFPRLVLPLVQMGTALYGFVITLAIVVVLSPVLGAGLGTRIFYLVPGTVLLLALTGGFCLVNSALHVYFRDVRYLVSAAMVVWMYVTPIIYPPVDAPKSFHLRVLLDVNPMTGVADLFHAATVGAGGAMGLAVAVSATWAVVLLAIGLALQCRFDRVFTDLL